MKFGKEFAAQMVPEWHEAYINYNELKTLLKQILRIKQKKIVVPTQEIEHEGHLYRTFSGLTGRDELETLSKMDEQAIVVSATEEEEGTEHNYRSTFLMITDESGQFEHTFFQKLDEQFNKVVKFYKSKEVEMIKEADTLTEQMDALIALRIKVHQPKLDPNDSDDIAASQMLIQPREATWEDESDERKLSKANSSGKDNSRRLARAPTEVLGNVELNVYTESPAVTLRNVLKIETSSDGAEFSKKELMKVEQRMKLAFNEFYQKLRYLKNYCFLNQLALSKIMKKYDKVTGRSAARAYLEMVDKSYLGRSDKVTLLMERVEATFIKHFENGNRRKGMSHLRLKAKKDKHRVTYFIGFFCGFSFALIMSIISIIHVRDLLKSEGREQYMENIFPLYSFFGYVVLHLAMFSGNIYFWKRYRVNYSFIFGFKPGTELGYRDVLLVSSGLSVLTLFTVLSNLEMDMNPKNRGSLTELVPLSLVIVLLLIMFCPFDIIYRENRFFFLKCIWRCIFAPLYKVTLQDFFLADQLTSQVQALRTLVLYICYYGSGDFFKRKNTCKQDPIYQAFSIIVALSPYWSRCLQCLRRLVEEGDSAHIINGLKYLSTIIAVLMRTTYDIKKGFKWKVIAVITSLIATTYSTYWDVIKDWGLLHRDSRNPWLRDKLVIPYNFIYFVAMIVNVILRLAWVQSVLDLNDAPFLHKRALVFVVACAEIVRRGIWNFFRLENEHLNNVGKFRAFKSVPLPFNFKGG